LVPDKVEPDSLIRLRAGQTETAPSKNRLKPELHACPLVSGIKQTGPALNILKKSVKSGLTMVNSLPVYH
jgi:hypothetical protein